MRIYNDYQDTKVLFKDLILDNTADIKSYMRWDNYDLNDTVIPVVETLKDHALIVLMNSYGKFHVEQDIIEEIFADVFIYFPILMQQLAITRLIDAYGVVKDDVESQTTERTENLNTNVEQNSKMTAGTTQTDSNILDTQQKTTGTIGVAGTASNTQNSTTNIENSSDVESTGTRNVNISHNMPEQALSDTGKFPTDPQGTPILTSSYIQQAQEGFTSSNPINTTELSKQTILNTNNGSNDTTTTNDITVSDTGKTTRTTTNSGSDNTEAKTATTGTNTFTETITSNITNKQYAYEIKAFLETADSLIAFKKWEDQFSWVVGII